MFRMGITIGFAKMKPGRGPWPAPRLEAETAASPVLDQSLLRRRPARKDELVDAVGNGGDGCGVRLLDGLNIRGESRTTPALKVVYQVPQAHHALVALVTRGGEGKGCGRVKVADVLRTVMGPGTALVSVHFIIASFSVGPGCAMAIAAGL